MMAVASSPGRQPRSGTPRSSSSSTRTTFRGLRTPVRCYDVAADGQRFFIVQDDACHPRRAVTHINLIQNWFEELKAKVPWRAGREVGRRQRPCPARADC